MLNRPLIEIITADITQLDVDIVVNAANEGLLGGSGVDGAIHASAGPQLLAYTRLLGGCPTGQARVSPGFALRALHIIHTVGPVWQGGNQQEAKLLATCYEQVFQAAMRLAPNHRIAFPAISTGVYGFPKEPAADIALAAMSHYRDQHQQIIACCYSDADADIYRKQLQAL